MLGKLIKKDSHWFVEFELITLPLHYEDVTRLPFIGQLHGGGHMLENKILDFDIIEEETGFYHGGLQPMDQIGGKGIQETINQYAKLRSN